jgi:plasmid stability protein
MAEERRSTPEELVARALESLSSEERQQATAWLLRRPATGARTGWLSRQTVPDAIHAMSTGQSFAELYGRGLLGPGSLPGQGQGNQVVPVRLPADLHARLREWSAEHGFSMATVVRGLVSRFLEGQEPGAAEPES